jgi:hypothetical protein
MGLYALASPQRRLKALANQTAEAQKALKVYDGEFAAALPLIRKLLATSMARLVLVLGPSLLAGLPVILVLLWIDDRYGAVVPHAGAEVTVVTSPPGGSLTWAPAAAAAALPEGGWKLSWPGPGESVRLLDAAGAELLTIGNAGAATVTQRSWWHPLFARRAVTLPSTAPIDAVTFGFPRREAVAFGPAWARGYLAMFIGVVCVASLFVKLAFRIA